jgi:hypothetical protein
MAKRSRQSLCVGCCWLFAGILATLALYGRPRAVSSQQASNTVAADAARSTGGVNPAARGAEGLDLFTKHVRLILAHKCVRCHGGEATESELNLVTREGLLKGGAGGRVIVPGDAKNSRLYKLVARQEEPYMPEEGEKLTKQELGQLARWIEIGAPYDKPLLDAGDAGDDWRIRKVPADAGRFWSFQPLAEPPLPTIKNPAWCRNDVDRFIAAKHDEKGLESAREADRRVLLRRVKFDLIGLPPTPDEIDAFLGDGSPDAYERRVDRLLASPGHGERWARHWLDVARFAESHGFEQDYDRPYAFHYRDFVIRALNEDMPYDRFVKLQLAGDEIEPENPLALMATGFLGAGVFPTQITANEVERTRYDALDDMAATTGTAMLGLTIGCARCHDHKFDPIPQGDYYRMISVFTTTVRSNIDVNLDPKGYRAAKAAFDREHAPLVEAALKYEREELAGRFAEWEAKRSRSEQPSWIVLDLAELKSKGGAAIVKKDDGSFLASGQNAPNDTYTVTTTTDAKGITAIRLEALGDASLPKRGPGRAENGNFALSELRVTATPKKGGPPAPVLFRGARATFEQKGLPAAAAIDEGPHTAWAIDPQIGKSHAAAFEPAAPIGLDGGTTLTFTLKFEVNKQHAIGRPRFSITTATEPVALNAHDIPATAAAALKAVPDRRTASQQSALLKWFGQRDPKWQALHAAVQEHLTREPKPRLTKVMVCSEGVPPIRHHTQGADFFNESFYLRRGNSDQKQEAAQPSYLQVLMKSPDRERHWRVDPPAGARTSFRRASLARWISDTEIGAGHLLARVIVNRLWQHHFGRGIVATASDFGKQGTPPTHPELLDHLANELIRGGWSLKRLHLRMLTSAAYRQSGAFRADQARIDPDNQWLWRRAPRRLEAEAIRDAMLAAAGLLDRHMYGPGTLEESHVRRSIYFTTKRSRLISMMQLFDAPEPLVSVGGRPSTTVAPQALLFMNNPQVRTWCAALGRQIAASASRSETAGIQTAYRMALGRAATDEELAAAGTFLTNQTASYAAGGKPNAAELAWADFCQTLFGLNEFIFVE